MESPKPILSYVGIGLGAIALMLALVHFWAGPFSPQPSIEQLVAEKAVSIRDAAISALKGEDTQLPPIEPRAYNTDQVVSITTSTLGGLAVILGIIGFARKEPTRIAGGAVVLGGGAIAFQFAVLALGIIVLVFLISAVLGNLGVG